MTTSSKYFKERLMAVDGNLVCFRYRYHPGFKRAPATFVLQLLVPYKGWIPFKQWTVYARKDAQLLMTKQEWLEWEKNNDETGMVRQHVTRLFKEYLSEKEFFECRIRSNSEKG